MLFVCVSGVMGGVFFVCIVDAWGCRCSCMGKYECFVMQIFVSCVHPVAVLSAAF